MTVLDKMKAFVRRPKPEAKGAEKKATKYPKKQVGKSSPK